MALGRYARKWLGLASNKALRDIREEVAQLVERLAETRRTAVETEARLQEELLQIRGEGEDLRRHMAALAERLDDQVTREEARREQMDTLRDACERETATLDELRNRLAGLTEQWRWETEDLRKALAALAAPAAP
jgi:chromosome segregation ATPase